MSISLITRSAVTQLTRINLVSRSINCTLLLRFLSHTSLHHKAFIETKHINTKATSAKMFKSVSTEKAFPPAAAYSQAVVVPHNTSFIYVSGQIPGLPPSTVQRDTIAAQTATSFANIRAILEDAGSSMSKIVKVTVFLSTLSPVPGSEADKTGGVQGELPGDVFARKYKEMNPVYAETFKDNKVLPARSCIGVAALPAGVDVEIEVVAYV